MGRKKKKQLKPWCWYCNREFEDEKVLIQHQKAKHFQCPICHKKLFTGPGLAIHCVQVHKQTVDKVPNALPNRTSTDIEIYGMEGIPDEDVKAHAKQKLGNESPDGEPESKKSKLPTQLAPPPLPAFGLPMGNPAMGFFPPHNPFLPVHPFGPPGFHHMPVASVLPHSMQGQAIPPPPPPAPVASVPTPTVISAPPKPTFPAYSHGLIVGNVPKVPKPTAGPQGIKVVLKHPEEDISLEERRANMPNYKKYLIGVPPPPPVPHIPAGGGFSSQGMSESIPPPPGSIPAPPGIQTFPRIPPPPGSNPYIPPPPARTMRPLNFTPAPPPMPPMFPAAGPPPHGFRASGFPPQPPPFFPRPPR
jgi:hypothetical protein